jgi:LacI family transcriptional regulator
VSKGAVSFALNGRPGVGHATRARILDAARALDWRPSTRARALSHSRAFALGLVMSRSPELLAADPFFPHFVAGVETVLAGCGYALVLQVVGNDQRAEADSYRRLARDDRVDGVFLTDLRRHDPRFQLLVELGLPGVAVAVGSAGGCPLPWVAVQDRHGVEQAVAHLVGLGHTRIAHVGGPPNTSTGVTRARAFRATVRDLGLDDDPALVTTTDHWSEDAGAAGLRRLLDAGARFTAIVAGNDLIALGCYDVFRERDISCPDEVSVVGFNDMPFLDKLRPPLTTIAIPHQQIGAEAARLLLDSIADPSRPARSVMLPLSLVVRGSTAAPAA